MVNKLASNSIILRVTTPRRASRNTMQCYVFTLYRPLVPSTLLGWAVPLQSSYESLQPEEGFRK